MRLARLVAAGLVLGALAGFLGALMRPRAVNTFNPGETSYDTSMLACRTLEAVS
jgi:hypothetical protein